jgi:hypothetical protein
LYSASLTERVFSAKEGLAESPRLKEPTPYETASLPESHEAIHEISIAILTIKESLFIMITTKYYS